MNHEIRSFKPCDNHKLVYLREINKTSTFSAKEEINSFLLDVGFAAIRLIFNHSNPS